MQVVTVILYNSAGELDRKSVALAEGGSYSELMHQCGDWVVADGDKIRVVFGDGNDT